MRKLFFVFLLFLVGCKQTPEQQKQTFDNIAKDIIYFYDKRTGICYAYYGGGDSRTITIVPYQLAKDHLVNPPEEKQEMLHSFQFEDNK